MSNLTVAARLPRLRQTWLKIHRWLGLGLLVLGVLLGVTGSINVYHREIDRFLDPSFYSPKTAAPPLSLDQLLWRARQADPAPVVSMILPDAYWPVVLVHQRREDGTVWRTALDPGSGEILGTRSQATALLPTIYRLHQNLLLKPYWGEELVGITGLLLLVSLGSGLYLWWPGWKKVGKTFQLPALQPLGRFLLGLHNMLGVAFTPVLMVVSLTGVSLVFPNAARFVLSRAVRVQPMPPPPLDAGFGAGCDSPEQILAIARSARPDDVPMVIVFPNGKKNKAFRVAMRPPDVHGTAGGVTQVWVDPWTRAVAQVRCLERLPAGERFMALQFPLHNGAWLGEFGRFLVFLSGLALAGLCLSGVWLSYQRHQLRERAAAKRKTTPQES
jgi:uncharacterized iron-regulated membrane protein